MAKLSMQEVQPPGYSVEDSCETVAVLAQMIMDNCTRQKRVTGLVLKHMDGKIYPYGVRIQGRKEGFKC